MESDMNTVDVAAVDVSRGLQGDMHTVDVSRVA